MKKTICFLSLLISLLSLVSCNVITSDNYSDKQLLSVLKNAMSFVSEDGENTYLQSFIYGNDEIIDYYAKAREYAFVDLDSDGENELVVDITPNQTFYMVFHKNGDNIYGFLFAERSLQTIKKDGSFIQTGGADINYYCKMEFCNDSYKIINTTIKDEIAGIYKTNGKETTIGAVDEYIKDWNLKKDIEWIKVS